jgi:hypothetical protein
VAVSGLAATTTGLIMENELETPFGRTSTTATRKPEPTWVAANPMPRAAYIEANILGTSARRASPSAATASLAATLSAGSGATRIGSGIRWSACIGGFRYFP